MSYLSTENRLHESLYHHAQAECLAHYMYSNICCEKKLRKYSVAVKSKTLISGSISLGFHLHTFRKKEKNSLVKISLDAKAEWITCSIHEAKYVGME